MHKQNDTQKSQNSNNIVESKVRFGTSKKIKQLPQRSKFHYVRDDKGFPLAVIATRDRLIASDVHRVSVGMSIWNKNDPFDKKLGRRVAEGRLLALEEGKQPLFSFEVNVKEGESPRVAVLQKCLLVANQDASPRIPERVQREIRKDLFAAQDFEKHSQSNSIPDEIA